MSTDERYECDKCGACCRHLIVEILELDLIRESRLREASYVLFKVEDGDDGESGVVAMLASGPSSPCRMLGEDNLCAVYPTRPNCCVAFMAGSEQCQDARRDADLPPLAPVAESASSGQPSPDQRHGEPGNNFSGHQGSPPR